MNTNAYTVPPDSPETTLIVEKCELDELSQRAERIRLLLRKSASLWLEIAREVTEARNVLSKDGFELFLAKSTLTQAIADKMPRIAQSSILYLDESKEHLERLEGCLLE